MATCERCGCGHAARWGKHHCKSDLPDMPPLFSEVEKSATGVDRPKADYHDRRAWLEHVTGQIPQDVDWRSCAAAYRSNAEIIAEKALAETTLRQATL